MVPPKMLFAVFGPDRTNFDGTPLGRRDAARDLDGLGAILRLDEEVSSERARNMPASPNSRLGYGDFDKTLTFDHVTLCGVPPGRHAHQLQDAGVAGGVRGGWVH